MPFPMITALRWSMRLRRLLPEWPRRMLKCLLPYWLVLRMPFQRHSLKAAIGEHCSSGETCCPSGQDICAFDATQCCPPGCTIGCGDACCNADSYFIFLFRWHFPEDCDWVLSAVLTKYVPKLLAQLLPRHRHQKLGPYHGHGLCHHKRHHRPHFTRHLLAPRRRFLAEAMLVTHT